MTNERPSESGVSCPLCGQNNPTLKRQIDPSIIIKGWVEEFRIDLTKYMPDIDVVSEFDCPHCRLMFFYPPSLAASAEIYTQLDNFSWYYMPKKWEHDLALQNIKNGQRVLEIGCGVGDFVSRMLDVGISAEGIELNFEAVKAAHSRGLPVHELNLADAAIQFSGTYDVVCSFQVLEHVPNPFDFVFWSCDLLKPGGKLILGLPNADSFLKHQFNLLDLPPHHMSRWKKTTLKYFPNLFPLQLLKINLEPLAPYHIEGYVKAYGAAIFGDKRSSRLFFSRLQRAFVALLRITKLRKFLTGQTLYASFRKIG